MPLSLQRARVRYLVGISMSENCMILSWAVAGSVFVHSWSGRGFFQQTALCRKGEKEFKICSEGKVLTGSANSLPSVFPLVIPG